MTVVAGVMVVRHCLSRADRAVLHRGPLRRETREEQRGDVRQEDRDEVGPALVDGATQRCAGEQRYRPELPELVGVGKRRRRGAERLAAHEAHDANGRHDGRHDNGRYDNGRGDRGDYRDGRQYDRRGYPQPHAEWKRGGRVPNEYRGRNYVVNDYRAYHLNAPPRGYQWVGVGGDYVLAAVATGIIAQIIIGQ